MAEVVVLGAGLSGTIMAYELLPQLRSSDTLTVVGQGPRYHFVPSNPWVAIGWRDRADIEVDLHKVMRRKGIRYLQQGARRVHPQENRIELKTRDVIWNVEENAVAGEHAAGTVNRAPNYIAQIRELPLRLNG